jgi:hypothetical protein
MTALERVVQAARDPRVRSATVYDSPTSRVTATRPHKGRRTDRQTTLVVTIGQPNYAQRQFVKRCQQAGVRFPIRKAQLRFWPCR